MKRKIFIIVVLFFLSIDFSSASDERIELFSNLSEQIIEKGIFVSWSADKISLLEKIFSTCSTQNKKPDIKNDCDTFLNNQFLEIKEKYNNSFIWEWYWDYGEEKCITIDYLRTWNYKSPKLDWWDWEKVEINEYGTWKRVFLEDVRTYNQDYQEIFSTVFCHTYNKNWKYVVKLFDVDSVVKLWLQETQFWWSKQINRFRTLLQSGTYLRELLLWENNLLNINSTTFSWLNNLLILYLWRNQINNIDDNAFLNLTNLETLNLWHNNLTSFNKHWVKNSTRLINLSISENKITEIKKDSFDNLKYLKELDIWWNPFWKLDKDYFYWINNLKNINYVN